MRLFFAATPDAVLRHRLAALATALGATTRDALRVSPPGQLHLTLHFLEDAPAERLDVLLRCAERAILPHAPFTVPLSGPEPFPSSTRPQVVVARCGAVPALAALAAALRNASRSAGLPAPRRRFRGHITLGRLRGGAAPALPPPQTLPPLDCHCVTLFQSELRPAGARHTALMEWPLGYVIPLP